MPTQRKVQVKSGVSPQERLVERMVGYARYYRTQNKNPTLGLQAIGRLQQKHWNRMTVGQRQRAHHEAAECFETLLDGTMASTLKALSGGGTGALPGEAKGQVEQLEALTSSAIRLRDAGALPKHDSAHISLTDALHEAQWLSRVLRTRASGGRLEIADRRLFEAEQALAAGDHDGAVAAVKPLRSRLTAPPLTQQQGIVLVQLEARAYTGLLEAYNRRAHELLRGQTPMSRESWIVVHQLSMLASTAAGVGRTMLIGNPELTRLVDQVDRARSSVAGLGHALNVAGIFRVAPQPKAKPQPLMKRLLKRLLDAL
ncbi:MAG: hypothetical protein IT371_04795 [Deltaproteobacteria bacterium]|nr:hypothetical protein [Deltaproteobacteria bacterium]